MLPGYSFRDPTVGTASYIAYLHLYIVKNVYETSSLNEVFVIAEYTSNLRPHWFGDEGGLKMIIYSSCRFFFLFLKHHEFSFKITLWQFYKYNIKIPGLT